MKKDTSSPREILDNMEEKFQSLSLARMPTSASATPKCSSPKVIDSDIQYSNQSSQINDTQDSLLTCVNTEAPDSVSPQLTRNSSPSEHSTPVQSQQGYNQNFSAKYEIYSLDQQQRKPRVLTERQIRRRQYWQRKCLRELEQMGPQYLNAPPILPPTGLVYPTCGQQHFPFGVTFVPQTGPQIPQNRQNSINQQSQTMDNTSRPLEYQGPLSYRGKHVQSTLTGNVLPPNVSQTPKGNTLINSINRKGCNAGFSPLQNNTSDFVDFSQAEPTHRTSPGAPQDPGMLLPAQQNSLLWKQNNGCFGGTGVETLMGDLRSGQNNTNISQDITSIQYNSAKQEASHQTQIMPFVPVLVPAQQTPSTHPQAPYVPYYATPQAQIVPMHNTQPISSPYNSQALIHQSQVIPPMCGSVGVPYMQPVHEGYRNSFMLYKMPGFQ